MDQHSQALRLNHKPCNGNHALALHCNLDCCLSSPRWVCCALQCLPPTTTPPPANEGKDDQGETTGEPEAPNTTPATPSPTPAPPSPTPAQLKDDLTCGCGKSAGAAVAISRAIASSGGCGGAAGQALARELSP